MLNEQFQNNNAIKEARDVLAKCGYIFLQGYMANEATLELARHLEETEQLQAASKVHSLVPTAIFDSTPNTYSGQYGHNEFPLHTDLAHWVRPPRYILLRCRQGNSQVSTTLLDGNQIVETIGARTLERTLVKPRRPLNGKSRLMRVFCQRTESLFRWDRTFIVPASPAGEIGVAVVANMLKAATVSRITLENTGDTLLIDNWRMLHGRSAIPSDSTHRLVERLYLENKR